jgi:hypothetical protein
VGQSVLQLDRTGFNATLLYGTRVNAKLVLLPPQSTTTVGARAPRMKAPGSGALGSASPVFAQAAEDSLHSCDLTLADKPDAQPYLRAADECLLATGAASSAQIASSPSYELSDDPLSAMAVIVTVNLDGTRQAGFPFDAIRTADVSYAVILDRSSLTPEGYGPWPS